MATRGHNRPRRIRPRLGPLEAAAGWAGRLALNQARRLAGQAGFAGRILILTWQGRRRCSRRLLLRLILEEAFKVISGSLVMVVLVGFMLGFLWTILWFGTLSNIGGLESMAMFLVQVHTVQITPIMTTVITILRYGAPAVWELAVMKSGRQFDVLVRLGVPPEHYLAAPRIIGAFLATPALLAVFTVASFAGAYYPAWRSGGQPVLDFIFSLSAQTSGHHFLVMAFKSLAISLPVSFFCVYNGFDMGIGGLDQGRTIIRRAMGESFFYAILFSVLVSVFFGGTRGSG